MSETKSIEERYADAKKSLDAAYTWKGLTELLGTGVADIKHLLDDLMAERGREVNLDEIFPKEVMEKAKTFYVKPCRENTSAILYPGLFTVCAKSYGIYGNGEYIVQALDDDIPRGINLATRRVRLGLTVEIVEED